MIPAATWRAILNAVSQTQEWRERLLRLHEPGNSARLHLTIMREPYLSRLLEGRKLIESRFSRDRRPPFARVAAGDMLLLKRAGGPLAGLALVERVVCQELKPGDLAALRAAYAAALAIDGETFWQAQTYARYVTLIWPTACIALPSIPLARRDRRGWVIIDSAALATVWSEVQRQPDPPA